MSVEEQIVANLRELPPEQRGEVLDFVEFLKHRRRQEREPRPFGLCAGEFEVPDDFDNPLPEYDDSGAARYFHIRESNPNGSAA